MRKTDKKLRKTWGNLRNNDFRQYRLCFRNSKRNDCRELKISPNTYIRNLINVMHD